MMQTGDTPQLDSREAKTMVLDALREDLKARTYEREGRWDTRFSAERDELIATLEAAGYVVPVDYLRMWDTVSDLRDELAKIK